MSDSKKNAPFIAPQSDAQRAKDKLRVANAYLSWRDCKLCGKPTIEGYVCYHCKEDDSDVR